ncbi:helix-turn-helix domain-containing protein [Nonomuraea angiospora]
MRRPRPPCSPASATASTSRRSPDARSVAGARHRPAWRRRRGSSRSRRTPLPPERGTSLAPTRAWALEHLDRPLTLADLARHARISVRTLTGRFHAETGLSPLQRLLHRRVDRARELLETTGLPMDQVAGRSGLGSADSLRKHLVSRVGLTPTAYRASFTQVNG